MAKPPAPPPGPATVRTISRLAGVAASTVSRALKQDPRVAPETRRRIAELALQAGYTPNAFARTLSGGRSGLVGLIVGPLQNPFYAELLAEAVAQAAALDLRLLLVHAGAGPIEDRTSQALLQYQVDGCLIASAELSSRAAAVCAARGVPIVMVNRVARLHASAVACDNLGGGADLAAFLLAGRHKRFGLVLGTQGTSTSDDRERGFITALAGAGMQPVFSTAGNSTYEGGHAAAGRIAAMSRARRPDAVFAINDIMAMGLLDGLREAGLQVPQDISVVGFDDIPAAARACYGLTTVAQPMTMMLQRGLSLLTGRIASGNLPDETVILRGQLVVRGSARRPP
ncbi:LacI family DNA-binding transcriptional regulator [Muricoccus pecuniae]|uniref:DNA-binding LacI/PurR family transcriptional regulator n=1 Tax=Muricoccus pecuniae TaxID=693023 RepID=A0A840YME6_9PROT|nr:LacI family DNA-binding transcriptional regulator [Roseomonas pecuniae]MBB5696173.1 DNA-binding LacI/PurR family transcriptional regulator [Roseomonas pecuniae]